jgi:prefoldin subunit 5
MFAVMGRVEDAERKLSEALERLEEAAERVTGSSSAAKVEGELTALRQRCETLEARNSEISQRLESAIGRLRTVLESDGGQDAGDGAG